MSHNPLWEQTFQVSDPRTTKVLTVTGERWAQEILDPNMK